MTLFHHPLRQLLSPLSPAEFGREVFGRQPWHLPGDAQRFEELFDWEALNQLLNLSLSSDASPSLRIFKDSRNFIFKKASENLQSILAHLRQGSTLILENIDKYDARLARFLDALSDELATETRINLYLSYPGTQGYPCHFDTHDFFILQIYGHKLWDVYPATIPAPLAPSPAFMSPGEPVGAEHRPPPESAKLMQIRLQPGDVLYVPKGFWHQALAEQEPSLHLTVGMYFKHGIDFLQWLVNELRELPAFRQPLPFVTKQDLPAAASEASPWQLQLGQLQQALGAFMAQPELIQRFHQAGFTAMPRRQAFFLPHQYAVSVAELSKWQSFRVISQPHYLFSRAEGLLELSYARQKLSFAPAARELLAFMLARESFTRIELTSRFSAFDWQDILQVLLPLVQDGLIVPEA